MSSHHSSRLASSGPTHPRTKNTGAVPVTRTNHRSSGSVRLTGSLWWCPGVVLTSMQWSRSGPFIIPIPGGQYTPRHFPAAHSPQAPSMCVSHPLLLKPPARPLPSARFAASRATPEKAANAISDAERMISTLNDEALVSLILHPGNKSFQIFPRHGRDLLQYLPSDPHPKALTLLFLVCWTKRESAG